MAILQAVLTMLFRQMGRLLNTAFGWATIMLFGKVPEDRQRYLSIVGFGSVLWIVVLIGIAFPRVGTFLLAFVPLPDWVDDGAVRLIMLGLTVFLPPLMGFCLLFVVDPDERPKGLSAKLKAILKGYPYTIGLAVTLIMMVVIAPIMRIRDLVKRWTSTHVPLIVESEHYLEVVGDIETVLKEGGFDTTRERAPALLRWPTKVFTMFAGGAVENLVADELTLLKSKKIEVLLHPSDLVIRGKSADVTRAHALVTEHLTFTKAYLTWSKEANEVEDHLVCLWEQAQKDRSRSIDALAELNEVDKTLKRLKVSYEEWETLFREKLLLERTLLQLTFVHRARRAS